MRLLNLFDGIGGFALAAEWMGWDNVASCEIDPFCRRVLDYHFNYKHIYHDIKTTDFTPLRGGIDLITGGFPCQPFSLAGNRRGTDDDRYLFPEMLRAIREVSPRWVVAENVRGLVTQKGGMVFEQVCASMEALGYEVQPFMVPACAVNAPHRRDRVWIVVHRADTGAEEVRERQDGVRAAIDVADTERGDSHMWADKGIQPKEPRREESRDACGKRNASNSECCRGKQVYNQVQSEKPNGVGVDSVSIEWNASDSGGIGFQGRYVQEGENGRDRQDASLFSETSCFERNWTKFPTQSPVCSGDDGLSSRLDAITFPKWREQSIKAYGNAVVPQVVYQIFRTIDDYETMIRQCPTE